MEKILVLNLGGDRAQLVARRVRECRVFSEIQPSDMPFSRIAAAGYKGIILSGDNAQAECDARLFNLGVPVLAIGGAAGVLCTALGGKKEPCEGENATASLQVDNTCTLFASFPGRTVCRADRAVQITQVPTGFRITAKTDSCPVAAMENVTERLFAVQFHPEDSQTPLGITLFKNFLYNACGCHAEWTAASFVRRAQKALAEIVGDRRVLCTLSGDLSSTVCALLLHKAVGQKLTAVFVDAGTLRADEAEQTVNLFTQKGIRLHTADITDKLLGKLTGIKDPATKHNLVCEERLRAFRDEVSTLGTAELLVRETAYTDVLSGGRQSGLEDLVDFTAVIEPLRDLMPWEIKAVAAELGVADHLVFCQPMPPAGLAGRIAGEVTAERLSLLRAADAIFREELTAAGAHGADLFFAALCDEQRSTVALRAVKLGDITSACWSHLSYEVLARSSDRIMALGSADRVVFDITSVPPAQIEW